MNMGGTGAPQKDLQGCRPGLLIPGMQSPDVLVAAGADPLVARAFQNQVDALEGAAVDPFSHAPDQFAQTDGP